MSIDNILSKKGNTIALITAVIAAILGGHGLYNDTTDTTPNELFLHVSAETPHLGTETKLDRIQSDITELKDMLKDLVKEVNEQKVIICSHDAYECSKI